MKIVINVCFGGFNLSKKAFDAIGLESEGEISATSEQFGMYHVDNDDFGVSSENRHAFRTDPRLIEVVERLGDEAGGRCAKLEVIEIPDDTDWLIDEYDGMETIHEKHRSWS